LRLFPVLVLNPDRLAPRLELQRVGWHPHLGAGRGLVRGLDSGTPILDRAYKGSNERDRQVPGHAAPRYHLAGHSSAEEDLLPEIMIGVLR